VCNTLPSLTSGKIPNTAGSKCERKSQEVDVIKNEYSKITLKLEFLISYSLKCYNFCGCSVNKNCSYCNSSDFIGFYAMQKDVYPQTNNTPNTNGKSCKFQTEYVDVNYGDLVIIATIILLITSFCTWDGNNSVGKRLN
jgi:hypothetical protein